MVTPTLIDLYGNELYNYSLIINLGRCDGCCNTVEDPFGRIYVPYKTEDVNLNVFDVIAGLNKAKRLQEHTLCDANAYLMVKKWNSKQNRIMINAIVSLENQ